MLATPTSAVCTDMETFVKASEASAYSTGGRARARAALLGETVVKAPET